MYILSVALVFARTCIDSKLHACPLLSIYTLDTIYRYLIKKNYYHAFIYPYTCTVTKDFSILIKADRQKQIDNHFFKIMYSVKINGIKQIKKEGIGNDLENS